MAQRGRKSAASLEVISVDGSPPPLQPPASLNLVEAKIFSDLVKAADKRHFRASDQPLLACYARAIHFETYSATALATDPSDTKALVMWEKASRAVISLSMRLRLSPQSRMSSKTTGRQAPQLPRPWE